MTTEINDKQAKRFGRQFNVKVIVALVILGSSSWGNAGALGKKEVGAVGATELRKSMMQGMKNLESMPTTGDTDHDFALSMKMHHQNALDMANIELKYGIDPALRRMAKAIITAQEKEIAMFDRWLAKHKKVLMDPVSNSK